MCACTPCESLDVGKRACVRIYIHVRERACVKNDSRTKNGNDFVVLVWKIVKWK